MATDWKKEIDRVARTVGDLSRSTYDIETRMVVDDEHVEALIKRAFEAGRKEGQRQGVFTALRAVTDAVNDKAFTADPITGRGHITVGGCLGVLESLAKKERP